MKRILIADDMPTVHEEAAEIAGNRYEILSSDTGEDALKKAVESKPDVILLDMYLDDADSADILQKLKNNPQTADIPVIITASDASVMTISRYYNLGACDFLKKPFVENILYRKVDVACALKDAGLLDLI